ncbi:amidohydrolase family protein [Daejeonella sp. H1SJ63]|uniref:amidohydrolase family protein n=1 Tax=Daejeonella sp. H1SJ63 TaxID=3034145 RepID=UPI0023EDF8B0|nr:amidohydrolase family protein [Daejeonella sp. H1SJ63]
MSIKNYSRREFLIKNSVAGLGTVLSMGMMPSLLAMTKNDDLRNQAEPIIDIHQHTDYSGRSNDLVLAHQRAMGVTTTILLPSGRPLAYGSTYYGYSNGLQAGATGNEVCYEFAQKHPGEFVSGANEVPDMPGAIEEIEKYLKKGAPVIGELKFGLDCDSAAMQAIYELAQSYNVPVLMHWQYNIYNRGFDRFHAMLKKYPKVNFIGHAQTWWANIDKAHTDQNILYPKTRVTTGGLTDRLLSEYPNLYGDFSAGSGLGSLTRDEEQASKFIERHQDKLLFGSDCSDKIGSGKTCLGANIITAIKRISSSKAIERKVLYGNAKSLFKL